MIYCNFTRLRFFLVIPLFLFSLTGYANKQGYSNAIALGSSNQVIVCFHGLGGGARNFSRLQEELKSVFPEATVVALNSVEGREKGGAPLTFEKSISDQAKLSFQELLEKVPNLGDKSILFIGHSQGGLRAYELYNQYRDKLHVKGIITLATPWEGAPGLDVDETLFNQLLFLNNAVQLDIQRLCQGLGTPAWKFNAKFGSHYAFYQWAGRMPGGSDLIPGSRFLSRIQHALSNETLPILAVGAGQSDFGSLVNKGATPSFKALNDIYTQLIVGKTYDTKAHDMLVPLGSQHGHYVFPKGKKNFTTLLIPDASHNGRALDYYPIIQSKSMSILDHNDMVKAVIAFSKNIFKSDQSRAAAAG